MGEENFTNEVKPKDLDTESKPRDVAVEFKPRDLIREVKKRPGIYDKDKLDNPKRDHKKRLWVEVAEILTPQVLFSEYTEAERESRIDEIQQKWKHLRDHFYREIKIMESGQPKKRKYVYYDDMEFMRPFVGFKMLPINRKLNDKSINFLYDELGDGGEGGDVFDQTYEELGPEEYEDVLRGREQKVTPTSTSHGYIDTNNETFKRQVNAIRKSNSSSSSAIHLRDGDIAFCLSLVPSLRKMGEAKKLRAKIDLLKIVHRYVEHEERQARLSQYTKDQTNEQEEVSLDNLNPDDMIIEDHTEDEEVSTIKIEQACVDPLHGQTTSSNKTWWK